MSRNSTLDEPADINADIGTPTWARGVARALEFQAKKLNSDVKSVHRWIELAAEYEAWRVLGYVSLDVFLVAEAAITQSVINAIRSAKSGTVGKAIADAKAKPLGDHGGDRKTDVASAIEQAKAEPLGEHGNQRMDQGRDSTLKQDRANTYTLRRLARDNPEMLNRIESGELSVNAAAIAAGIRKKPTHAESCVKSFRKAEDRLSVVSEIVKSLAPHERAWLIDLLSQLKEPTQ